MRRIHFCFLLTLAVLGSLCLAAPMTVKELEFLLRVGTPESEIVRQLTARRLMTPLDDATEQQLKAKGATPNLIMGLKSGAFTLAPDEARAAAQRKSASQQRAAKQMAEEQAQADAAPVPAPSSAHGTVQNWLRDQLVYQAGGTLKAYDDSLIRQTHVFAFYAAASSNGPCKQFTPKFVAAYRALKDRFPELEVILVSSDRDEFNMTEHMRASAMPWPALKYHQMPPQLAGFFGESIPWLVLVGDDGTPLSKNGVDKQYLDPERLLEALDPFLTQRRAQGL